MGNSQPCSLCVFTLETVQRLDGGGWSEIHGLFCNKLISELLKI